MTLTPENQKIFNERLAELPEAYVTFVQSKFVQDVSAVIKEKHNLDDETTTAVENQFVLSLLLFIPLNEISLSLREEVSLGNSVVQSIASDFTNALPKTARDFIQDVNTEQNKVVATENIAGSKTLVQNAPKQESTALDNSIQTPVQKTPQIGTPTIGKTETIKPVMPISILREQTEVMVDKNINILPETEMQIREQLRLRPEHVASLTDKEPEVPNVLAGIKQGTLSASRTMAGDAEAAKHQTAQPSQEQSGNVPRYAKPMTEAPKQVPEKR